MLEWREDQPRQVRRLNQTHIPKAPEGWHGTWLPDDCKTPFHVLQPTAPLGFFALWLPLGQWRTGRESKAGGKWAGIFAPLALSLGDHGLAVDGLLSQDQGSCPAASPRHRPTVFSALPLDPAVGMAFYSHQLLGALSPLIVLPLLHLQA